MHLEEPPRVNQESLCDTILRIMASVTDRFTDVTQAKNWQERVVS